MAAKIKENFLKLIGVSGDINDGNDFGADDKNYSTTDQDVNEDAQRQSNIRRSVGSSDNNGPSRRSNAPYNKVSPSSNEAAPRNTQAHTNFVKMIVFQPQTYEDTQTIIDNLRKGQPVIVNLETLNTDISQRVLDFVSGAIYALNGNIRKVSKGIFLLAPYGVDVTGNFASDYASNNKPSKGSFTTPRV